MPFALSATLEEGHGEDGQSDDGLDDLPSVATVGGQVIDLSCRKRPEHGGGGPYYVVTNKWQTFTDFQVRSDGGGEELPSLGAC